LTGAADLDDQAGLALDLGMDSLARADLLLWLQSEFGFPQGDVDSVATVGDVMLAACGEAMTAAARELKPVPAAWFRPSRRLRRPERLAEMTVAEAFLAQARRAPGKTIVADQAGGARTYRDLVVAATVLRGEIDRLPGDRIGIMLPASVATTASYLAVLVAGRTPVMVNWTQGPRHVAGCLDAVGVACVLTARRLVGRLRARGVDLGAIAGRFVYLEDVAARLGRWRKLRAWLASRLPWPSLRPAPGGPAAAILFTSGSETRPKAVPLSHRNLLVNVADGDEAFTLLDTDRILGILPPFHAFGLTSSIVLPLCLGVPVVFHPDPTDGATLGRIVDAYGATILIGTPTFLHGIVRARGDWSLDSLRLVVTGAERCSPRAYQALARRCPQAVVLEGYGVTECSPIISVNRETDPQAGTIGRPLASVECAVVDPDTLARVQAGEAGMLLVRGPSVFGGYLDYEGPSPFVEFEGRQWYRTGDLVSASAGGVLTFRGRLGRFVKLGGEMISLPAVEAALEPHYAPAEDEGPVLAVVATGEEDRPEIVIFTTRDVDRETVNRRIHEAGLSPLHNVRRVIRVDQLPLLGTGKTDYRALAAELEARPS
jgi:long-chain-fatty-acid--[acyl-carrier-protein] ligase